MTLLERATEAEFQALVIDYARLKKWRVHHTRPAMTKHGWATPLQGDKGFPDLCLARNGEVVFLELKSETGQLTGDQQAWLLELDSREGTHQVYWFRPSEWKRIEEILS